MYSLKKKKNQQSEKQAAVKFYETEICSGFGVVVQRVELQQKQEEPQVQESDRVAATPRDLRIKVQFSLLYRFQTFYKERSKKTQI